MNSWRVLPQPERFSELYFTDYRQLPTVLAAGATQKLNFTIHNLEHQTTTYRYKLLVVSADGGETRQVGDGTIMLAHGGQRTIRQNITLPAFSGRADVKVVLTYKGVAFGSSTLGPQTQSIDYWVTIAGHATAGKEQP